MTIGINATAAVKQPRTGVEEYAYQLIKHLTMLPEAGEHRFLLYLPSVALAKEGLPDTNTRIGTNDTNKLNPSQPPFKKGGENPFDFPLPPNFEIKILRWPLPFLWTQARLAWELWRYKLDALFVPVHILPFGAPKNSTVAIHGLEYEYFPECYPLWRRLYLRWSTKRAARRARKIIAVSEKTKNDLVKLYGVAAGKISVVHHGISFCHSEQSEGSIIDSSRLVSDESERAASGLRMTRLKPYILYLGRLETKKNIQGILSAYEILKKEYRIPHQLVLAGGRGYGYEALRRALRACSGNITELGYVDEDEKRQLLVGADIFLFPSFYEGFGLPILEAQSAGAPVVTSYGSCLPEIAGQGALFVNPRNPAQIAEAVKLIIDDIDLRDRLRQSGFDNIKRFSWEECARETLAVITK